MICYRSNTVFLKFFLVLFLSRKRIGLSIASYFPSTTLALRSICDIHLKLEWEVGTRWFVDEDINEVIVAFG